MVETTLSSARLINRITVPRNATSIHLSHLDHYCAVSLRSSYFRCGSMVLTNPTFTVYMSVPIGTYASKKCSVYSKQRPCLSFANLQSISDTTPCLSPDPLLLCRCLPLRRLSHELRGTSRRRHTLAMTSSTAPSSEHVPSDASNGAIRHPLFPPTNISTVIATILIKSFRNEEWRQTQRPGSDSEVSDCTYICCHGGYYTRYQDVKASMKESWSRFAKATEAISNQEVVTVNPCEPWWQLQPSLYLGHGLLISYTVRSGPECVDLSRDTIM